MKMKVKLEAKNKYLKIELRDGLGIVEESSRAKDGGSKDKNSESNNQRKTCYH
jgi:hypothetical protein